MLRPTALSISPVAALLKTVGGTLLLTVLATFSGNVQIDVTQSSSLAITSENPNVVTIQNGILVAVGSGQTKVDVVYGSARATLAVTVPAQITGDLNHDGAVDCADLSILQASMSLSSGQPGFDARADLNGDGIVNTLDLNILISNWPPGVSRACN